MATKRLVGIDFGTSTSVVMCKRYEVHERNGEEVVEPIGNAHHTDAVTFGQGASDPRALTIVRINEDGTIDCGIDEFLEGATVYREFKMSLESENEEEQERARELTHGYMTYLYDRYSYQKGYFGECDEEETIISFPAKWKAETRRFMTLAVADAGFENVSSLDEPSAALFAILAQEMNKIRDNKLIEKDKDNLILVIDMGAGTTDLAVCKCNVSAENDKVTAMDIKNELLFSWPEDSVDITFGGREIDEKLKDFLVDYIVSCGLPKEAAENFIRNNTGVKGWKEETLSPSLGKNKPTKACTVAKQAQTFAPIKKEFPEITRESFEKLIEDKLEDYKNLVKGCLDKLDENAEIDVVIFTGGHSAWYFAKELVDGTMKGIDHPALRKVQAEKKRVFSLPHPQETVALGMVYSKLPFKIIDTSMKDTKVQVPNFVNTSYERFTSNRVKNEDFIIKTIYESSQAVGKGYIISQSINPGEMVEKGTEITIVISKGADEQSEKVILSGDISGVSNGASLYDRAKAYLEKNKKTAKSLSSGNVAGLRTHLNIPQNETCYFWKDTTLFGSGKNGFAITDKGFYYRGLWSSPVSLYWYTYRNDVSIALNDVNGIIAFNLKGGYQYTAAFLASQKAQALDFFVGLQEALGKEAKGEIKKDGVSLQLKFDKNLDAILTEIFGEIPLPGSVTSLKATMNSSSLKVKVKDKIYFAYDDTILSNGKRGVLIDKQGIWCAQGNRNGWDYFLDDHRINFTLWSQFVNNEITMKDTGIYSGNQCIFNVASTYMLNLYKDLRKKLIENNVRDK